MGALIEIHNLVHLYGDHRAVDDISFELHAGEVLGFLGPNGAGKSTTMQMITGGLPANAGRVLLDGIDLARQPVKAKRQLGYLPENPPLYPDMTVDEYLGFCARLHQIPRNQVTAAMTRTKVRCGLEGFGPRLIANLSKGYKQRVGIAQAILHQPRMVVLDEPTSGLDPNQIQEIRSLIRELASECGVLLSTHILPEVQSVCDRVIIINSGKLVYSDRVARLTDNVTNQLQIRLLQQPPLAQLQRLSGVSGVEQLGAGEYRLTLSEPLASAEIAEQLVAQDWGLLQMQTVQGTLEQAFARLTTQEPLS